MRLGWKSSSASSFSPVPMNLIGLPVTARIDSAAPPRPSPSTRVSTMPVMIDAGIEGAREIDRVLAGQRVGDEQDFVRIGRRLDRGRLGHQLFVDMGAAGGVEDQHVIAAEPALGERAAGNLDRGLAGDDRQGGDADLLAEHAQLLHGGRAAGVERGEQDLLVLPFLEALGDLGAWSWSCPNPAGRPSGWRRAAWR